MVKQTDSLMFPSSNIHQVIFSVDFDFPFQDFTPHLALVNEINFFLHGNQNIYSFQHIILMGIKNKNIFILIYIYFFMEIKIYSFQYLFFMGIKIYSFLHDFFHLSRLLYKGFMKSNDVRKSYVQDNNHS